MSEPESINTLWHDSFVKNTPSLTSGNLGYSMNSNTYPLKATSEFNQKLTLAPAANAVLCNIAGTRVPAGYYEIQVMWGNVKVIGTADPAVSDLDNFFTASDGIKFERLVSLGAQAMYLRGYASFPGGVGLQIMTDIAATANVLYMAGIMLTRVA